MIEVLAAIFREMGIFAVLAYTLVEQKKSIDSNTEAISELKEVMIRVEAKL